MLLASVTWQDDEKKKERVSVNGEYLEKERVWRFWHV
jgi:hypothetical protein